MSLIARFFEERGIPTVSLFLQEPMAKKVPAPRMLQVNWPFGHPYGEANHPRLQTMVLHRLLTLLNSTRDFGHLDQPEWPWRRTNISLPKDWQALLEEDF
ncbi:MAG: hypothetical protein ABEJ65_01850 [bacterium]